MALTRTRILPLLGTLVVNLSCSPEAPPCPASQKIPLYNTLGSYTRPITTNSRCAQAYFDQGLRLGFGFARKAAVQSFRTAQESDRKCAMCFWGEAWARGPYLNSQTPFRTPSESIEAINKARNLYNNAAAWEKALIDAMAERYSGSKSGEEYQVLPDQYAKALQRAADHHPNNIDIRLLLAESLMLLDPWNLWTKHGQPKAETQKTIEQLEIVRREEPDHPGACHLYIHARV